MTIEFLSAAEIAAGRGAVGKLYADKAKPAQVYAGTGSGFAPWLYIDPATGLMSGPDGAIKVGRVLSQTGIAFAIPSSGSISNNGALTVSTAFSATHAGLYLYFPASAIASGVAAGWYWTVMSSTTAGTIYNNRYTSGQPTVPASPTAFATTGPGAYTGVSSVIEGPQVSIAGGLMGVNGQVSWDLVGLQNNSAGTKGVYPALGGAFVSGWQATTSASPNSGHWVLRNAGKANAQVYHNSYVGEPTYASGAVGTTAIDTSVTQTISVYLQHETATDWVMLVSHSIQMVPHG